MAVPARVTVKRLASAAHAEASQRAYWSVNWSSSCTCSDRLPSGYSGSASGAGAYSFAVVIVPGSAGGREQTSPSHAQGVGGPSTLALRDLSLAHAQHRLRPSHSAARPRRRLVQ